MMTRVQILLPQDQDRRLEALATKRRESKSKLIRRALDLLLRTESAEEEEEPLLSLIGQAGRGRRPDASDRHDWILAGSERARNRPR
jgi:Arc/MetJ-type ribon-helix-helix transcriptional regulator